MEFIKLNNNWGAEPNAPIPKIEIDKNSSEIKLSFYLNSFIYEDIDEEDMGILEFNNCYKYRLGATNDEGFYLGKCRFSKTGVKWGEFYCIKDSGWKKHFPNDEKIVDSNLKDNLKLNHYLFYFRDETFECIAENFDFNIIRADNQNVMDMIDMSNI